MSACANEKVITEYVEAEIIVPDQLLQPVGLPDREITTLQGLGVAYADAVEGLSIANGRIVSLGCIIRKDSCESGANK